MKYRALRFCIKRFVEPKKFVLSNCKLVVDARSILGGTYEDSGCQFTFGGEMDRFASYLRTQLAMFKDNNVTCYFIIKGGRYIDEERRIEIYQELIDKAGAVTPEHESPYCDPAFVKEVFCEVLDELGIKWFVSEYDVRESLLTVARRYNCPVITNNLELCLYGVSCILRQSVASDIGTGNITFDIYQADACRRAFFIKDNLMPVFLTLVDEDGILFEKIPEIISCPHVVHVVPALLKWIRRQSKDYVINVMLNNLGDETDKGTFMITCDEHEKLYRNHLPKDGVKYFENENKIELHENDSRWFIKGVSNGRIPVTFINLYHHGILSGSWLVQDEGREDAMLPAMEIIEYGNGLLTNFQDKKITFFGRKDNKCCPSEIEFKYEPKMSSEEFFKKTNKRNPRHMQVDFFLDFIKKVMPGFNYELLIILDVPEECWILMMTLVFYCLKNPDKILAYSFLLSYVMLGSVTDKAGVIKRSNLEFIPNEVDIDTEDVDTVEGAYGLSVKDCVTAARKLLPLFEISEDSKRRFDRSILHSFAEFQHCLQHMNHLNKLCGEKIKCTIYHRVINTTFAFNAYQKLKSADGCISFEYIDNELGGNAVLELFSKLVESFDQLLMMHNNVTCL